MAGWILLVVVLVGGAIIAAIRRRQTGDKAREMRERAHRARRR